MPSPYYPANVSLTALGPANQRVWIIHPKHAGCEGECLKGKWYLYHEVKTKKGKVRRRRRDFQTSSQRHAIETALLWYAIWPEDWEVFEPARAVEVSEEGVKEQTK